MKREEQLSFGAWGFDRFARSTKRAAFLSEMDRIAPWERLCAVVRPHYPTGEGGR
ncbi:MAG: IS5/IS1182 family transposase, partial [Candidatus Cybelea sp.]